MAGIFCALKNWKNKRYEVYYDGDKTTYILCEDVEIVDDFVYCKMCDKDEIIMLSTNRIDAIIISKGKKTCGGLQLV